MPLLEGDKLGPYAIAVPIGAGGMGEVYRAHDPRVGRDVAVKISAERFTERFEREARAIAALNHPNICTLYDVGPDYLVMELVEGPTLAERIGQGPIPLEEALDIAKQIAAALESAHEKGIVHRDLKPGNVKTTSRGMVKVLDFGLAKVGATPTVPSDNSPTLTVGQTKAGVILGTAAYMSPEQAKGKPVDKRADIWAFGVVLYEMLTAHQLFSGETVSETLASVLKEEPVWDSVPAKVQRLLRSCLQKDPNKRLRDIADWKLLLDDAVQAAPPAPRRGWLWPGAAAFLLLAAVALAYTHWSEQPPPVQIMRFQVAVPDQVSVVNTPPFAVSPDGRYLAFEGADSSGLRLWVRSMDSLEAHPLPDSDLSNTVRPIFWSPDSRFIAFDVGGKLKKIDIAGGPPRTIGDLPVASVGGSWNRDGVIILGSANGLMRIPAAGGNVSPLTVLGSGEGAHTYPVFLPDGKHFLYVRATAPGAGSIYAGSLDAKPEEQNSSALLQSGVGAGYVASGDGSSGQMLFVRQGALLSQTFDSQRLQLIGDPVQVADRVGTSGSLALFSASANGHLIYRTAPTQDLQLTWFDRQGRVLATVGEPGRYNFLALSPDSKRAVVTRIDPQSGNADLWLTDLANGASTRLTFDRASGVRQAAWSPDGSKIIFLSNRDGAAGLYQKATNGAGSDELLFKGQGLAVNQWSRDDRYLIFGMSDPQTKNDLWLMPVSGERKPIPWNRALFDETGGRISPDGRWAAYRSNESGRSEVYVQPFSPAADAGTSASAGKWMVSRGSLGMARWREDSKELYYLTTDAKVMAVAVSAIPAFQAGPPTVLFQVPAIFLRGAAFPGTLADATTDGKKFLFAMPVAQSGREEYTVVLNWQAALKK